jgi:hypothetical protein
MIRIVVQTDDASMAANVGGSVHTAIRTFDIDAPEIEAFLRADLGAYTHRQIMGVEVLPAAPPDLTTHS